MIKGLSCKYGELTSLGFEIEHTSTSRDDYDVMYVRSHLRVCVPETSIHIKPTHLCVDIGEFSVSLLPIPLTCLLFFLHPYLNL